MFRIAVRHGLIVKKPANRDLALKILAENQNDWTHFTYIHRKHILDYHLVYKTGNREIFLYKARVLYPFPFYNMYLVFRDYVPEQNSYRNIYLDLKTKRVNYLDGYIREQGEDIFAGGNFVFELPGYWKYFSWLFPRVFQKRMMSVIEEDNEHIRERIQMKGFENESCAPKITEYDLFKDLFRDGKMPKADVTFDLMGTYPTWEKSEKKSPAHSISKNTTPDGRRA